MKHLIFSATAILAAWLGLWLLIGAVQAGPLVNRVEEKSTQAASKINLNRPRAGRAIGPVGLRATSDYSLTRIVTVTVGTPVPLGLASRWQIDLLSQDVISNSSIRLPSDAYAIIVTMVNGQYSIDYSGPTIYISNSQGLYYEYSTNQQALRYGNQILISQAYAYNRPLHYIATLTFTDPFQYLGYAGYVPAQTTATQLLWDEAFAQSQLNEFSAAVWLVNPAALPRPDLQIISAALQSQFNHVRVSAIIRNNGLMTTGTPAFINLYDRANKPLGLLPSGPLDLTDGWCSLTPIAQCGGSLLPLVPPGQTVIYTADADLTPVNGRHDIYLFVDALGIFNALGLPIPENEGLNYEYNEQNNARYVDSVSRQDVHIFLPLIKRK